MQNQSFFIGFMVVFFCASAFVAVQVFLFFNRQKSLNKFLSELGFSHITSSKKLSLRLSKLYPDLKNFEIQDLAQKNIADAEMFIFTLVDISGGENSIVQRNAIAITSPSLNLPHFIIIPKLNRLLTAILEHSLSSWGEKLNFKKNSAIDNRYIILSKQATLANPFINEKISSFLSVSQSFILYAGEDTFTFAEFQESNTIIDSEGMERRIQCALHIFNQCKTSKHSEIALANNC